MSNELSPSLMHGRPGVARLSSRAHDDRPRGVRVVAASVPSGAAAVRGRDGDGPAHPSLWHAPVRAVGKPKPVHGLLTALHRQPLSCPYRARAWRQRVVAVPPRRRSQSRSRKRSWMAVVGRMGVVKGMGVRGKQSVMLLMLGRSAWMLVPKHMMAGRPPPHPRPRRRHRSRPQ